MLSLLILFLLLIAFFLEHVAGLLCKSYSRLDMYCHLLLPSILQTISKSLELYIPYPAVTPTSKLAFFDQVFAFHLDEAFMQELLF